MKSVKVTRGQHRVLQNLTRKDVRTLRKYPRVLAESKLLLRTCKKVIKRIEAIPEYASRRKRQTAYKRVIRMCRKAIESVEQ